MHDYYNNHAYGFFSLFGLSLKSPNRVRKILPVNQQVNTHSTALAAPLAKVSLARKINLGHFAFYRGWLEGLDLADLGERYLPTGRDLPEAKQVLRWLQLELVAAAKRARPGLARLLSLPPDKLKALSTPLPSSGQSETHSLDDFRVEFDPDSFYEEAELIKHYQAHFGGGSNAAAMRKAQRNARMLAKLRSTVTWLETWMAVPPHIKDPVEGWLTGPVVQRLHDSGLRTLADVVRQIEKYGPTWHRRVEKLGPVGAERLQRWLEENKLMSTSAVKALAYEQNHIVVSGIVPIERLLMPDELMGHEGPNRDSSPVLEAQNDFEAIQSWLASQAGNANTQRNYRGQAERFLLWMVFERNKAMSSASTEDCIAYREFLDNLSEERPWYWATRRSDWVGGRAAPRTSEDWRPFTGPLAPSSQRQALVIVTGLFEWLCRQRYLKVNPWDQVPSKTGRDFVMRTDHSLTVSQWEHCVRCLQMLPRDEKFYRLWAILHLAFIHGLRLAELAQLGMARPMSPGRISPGIKPAPKAGDWDMDILGKGNKLRRLPLGGDALKAILAYGAAQGLPASLEQWPAGEPLFKTLGGAAWKARPEGGPERQPLSASQIYRSLKAFFKWAAAHAESPGDAAHLTEASTHWLRHTHATLSIESGADIVRVQENLGHSSVAVTGVYIHGNRQARKATIERLEKFAGTTGPKEDGG